MSAEPTINYQAWPMYLTRVKEGLASWRTENPAATAEDTKLYTAMLAMTSLPESVEEKFDLAVSNPLLLMRTPSAWPQEPVSPMALIVLNALELVTAAALEQ